MSYRIADESCELGLAPIVIPAASALTKSIVGAISGTRTATINGQPVPPLGGNIFSKDFIAKSLARVKLLQAGMDIDQATARVEAASTDELKSINAVGAAGGQALATVTGGNALVTAATGGAAPSTTPGWVLPAALGLAAVIGLGMVLRR